jgi:hypothetical protein
MTIGSVLIVIAGAVVAFAYLTRPSAASCSYADQVTPGSCGANPAAGVLIAAGVLAVAGVLMLVTAAARKS